MMRTMWTKICGITNLDDAAAAAAAGVSAIGLNFFRGSKRFITEPLAAVICESLQGTVDLVGVFVNADPAEVARTVAATGITAVQFHGDEPLDQIAEFAQQHGKVRVIRAIRADSAHLESAMAGIDQLLSRVPVAAVLLDAYSPHEFGGTGTRADASVLCRMRSALGGQRIIVAGGLTPENVSDAVSVLRPWGVDTASGVEDQPGRKNHQRMQDFVAGAGGPDPERL